MPAMAGVMTISKKNTSATEYTVFVIAGLAEKRSRRTENL